MSRIKFVNILEVDEITKEKVRKWRNDDYVRCNMLSQHIIRKNEHREWLEKLERDNTYLFWVVFIEQIAIGAVYLTDIDIEQKTAEWGYYIGESKYRNKGLGKEILLHFLNIVFDKLKISVIMTRVLSHNERAMHIYNDLGFREISTETSMSGSIDNAIRTFYYSKDNWKQRNQD